MRSSILSFLLLLLTALLISIPAPGSLGRAGAVESRFGTIPIYTPVPELAAAVADDDDEDDAEDAEEKIEVPPPPYDSLLLPDDIDPKVQEEYNDAYELVLEARKNYSSKSKRKDAIRAMTRLKKKLPSGEAHFQLGLLYQWGRDFKRAKKVLEELIEMQPGFYEGYVELGDVYVWLKKMDKAIPEYEKALEIYPHFEYGVDRMMMVLIQLGRFDEAQEFVDRALMRGPSPLRLQCQQAVKMVKDGPDWGEGYTVETENYIVKSDVSESYAREFAENAELIRELYDSLFPEIEKPDRKYLVLVFKDRAGYLAAGAPPSSAGVYMPLSRRLMLYKTPKKSDAIMTLKHEGFHQYCHEYLDNIPQWFNEGLADTFAATRLVEKGKKRSMKLLPNSKRMEYLINAIRRGGHPSLKRLMHMTRNEMYDTENENKQMFLHYCIAWSICYFCITGGNSKYQSSLKGYFKALRKGKTQQEAYDATFGKLNMQKFQEQWHAYMLGEWNSGGAN